MTLQLTYTTNLNTRVMPLLCSELLIVALLKYCFEVNTSWLHVEHSDYWTCSQGIAIFSVMLQYIGLIIWWQVMCQCAIKSPFYDFKGGRVRTVVAI